MWDPNFGVINDGHDNKVYGLLQQDVNEVCRSFFVTTSENTNAHTKLKKIVYLDHADDELMQINMFGC